MCQVNLVISIIVLIITSVILYALWFNKCLKPPTESYNSDYATLGTLYDTPLFEPNLLQRCAEGSYMYTDNPALSSFCSAVPTSVLDKVSCKRAYHGRPFHLDYTVPAYACSTRYSEPCRVGCVNKPLPCDRVERIIELA